MTDFAVAQCRSCHARIIWTTNIATGKRMPVDAAEVEDGNVILLSGNDGPEARVLSKADVEKRPTRTGLRKSHFATCNDPERWRKK